MTTEFVRALIVDASADDDALIRKALSTADFEIDVWTARSVEECLQALTIQRFDVVLCDYRRLATDGLRLITTLRDLTRSPAIILITNSVDPELVAEAFRRGINDYVCTNKMSAQRLQHAVINAAHWTEQTQRYQADEELAKLLAVTDPLTGVYNRRYLSESLRAECSRARRYQRPLSVIMAGVNGLQGVHDRHGPIVSDRAIRDVATSLRETCRQSDIVARLNDDFCVVMPETPHVGANQVADRIVSSVGSRILKLGDGQTMDVAVNIGLVTSTDDETLDPDRIIQFADDMLREASVRGTRCVMESRV